MTTTILAASSWLPPGRRAPPRQRSCCLRKRRYRETLRDPRRVWRRWDVADKALLLCAYVTCSSFGFFWAMGHHRGLKSLGLIMALGTACIYLATIMVLRPLLLWRLARRQKP